jgi:hypothetical protein
MPENEMQISWPAFGNRITVQNIRQFADGAELENMDAPLANALHDIDTSNPTATALQTDVERYKSELQAYAIEFKSQFDNRKLELVSTESINLTIEAPLTKNRDELLKRLNEMAKPKGATVGLEEEDPAVQAAAPKAYYYCDDSFSTTEPPEFQLKERLVDAQTKEGLVSSIMNGEITVPKSSRGDVFSGVREMEDAKLPSVDAADRITIYKSTSKGLVTGKPKQGLQVVISK